MYFKAREPRDWIYTDLFPRVPHAIWKHIAEFNSFFLFVIQAYSFSLSMGLTKISATAPEMSLAVVFFYYVSHIFIFNCVRGILILVIQILLYSYQGFHCQVSNNSKPTELKHEQETPIQHQTRCQQVHSNQKLWWNLQSWAIQGFRFLRDPSTYNWIAILVFHSVQWRKDVFIWKPSPDTQKTTVKCSNSQKLLFSKQILKFFKVYDLL